MRFKFEIEIDFENGFGIGNEVDVGVELTF
jgi:hypothetical protein